MGEWIFGDSFAYQKGCNSLSPRSKTIRETSNVKLKCSLIRSMSSRRRWVFAWRSSFLPGEIKARAVKLILWSWFDAVLDIGCKDQLVIDGATISSRHLRNLCGQRHQRIETSLFRQHNSRYKEITRNVVKRSLSLGFVPLAFFPLDLTSPP